MMSGEPPIVERHERSELGNLVDKMSTRNDLALNDVIGVRPRIALLVWIVEEWDHVYDHRGQYR